MGTIVVNEVKLRWGGEKEQVQSLELHVTLSITGCIPLRSSGVTLKALKHLMGGQVDPQRHNV